MGRVEKIVVLTVLFLVAVILGVSLNSDGGSAKPDVRELAKAPAGAVPAGSETLGSGTKGAVAANRDRGAPQGASKTAGARPNQAPSAWQGRDSQQVAGVPTTHRENLGRSEPGPSERGAAGLLSAVSGDAPVAPNPIAPRDALPAANPGGIGGQPVAAPPGAVANAAQGSAAQGNAPREFLRSTDGLSASRVADLMIYTWRDGDSYTALSDRYYGSRLETGRLRAANEGREETDLRAGDKIFVPVRAASAENRLARSSDAAGTWQGGLYVVQGGDMLSTISKKVYGSAGKWRSIYDANRDVLASPDDLKVGTKLRIPQ